ncbi:MAG: hypothetical protein JJU45_19095 [Acidimicrobiia bacterium]|nr:hypothetical protein [Acidimicrobiia bacterium]
MYKVVITFSDGTSHELEELCESESEANDYGMYMASCYSQGQEILHMSNPGDYPLTDDEADFEVIEI